MRRLGFLFALSVVASAAFAQAPPPASAEAAINAARGKAIQGNKAVFVRFTASWCGWCHKMQGVLDKPEIKAIWDKYFVSQPIIVLENGDKEKLENPGGEKLMESVGGKNQGIPFFYFADAKTGRMIVNSLMYPEGKITCNGVAKAANVGCPYEPNEVAFFMQILKKAAPKMSDAERTKIQEAFASLKKAGG